MVKIAQNAVSALRQVSPNPMQNIDCRGRLLSVFLTENLSRFVMQKMHLYCKERQISIDLFFS